MTIMPASWNGAIASLKNNVSGQVVLPDDANYDEVRKIWNGMIDRRPAVIVRCATASDVPVALKFALDNGKKFSIRGAGHNIAGNSICDDGVVIDFSAMKKVRVDVEKKRAFVEPGATLGDLDATLQAHGLVTPVGINSTTGIAGLTLGGGFGWLTRKYGMTIDCLVSVNVVTANGENVRASEMENADLFWAIRGGGGNFGIVTQFEFQLHQVGPEILAGLIVFPLEQAKQVLTRYRDLAESAPEELTIWVVMRQAPPLPFLPAEVHGKDVAVLAIFYAGNIAEGERLIHLLTPGARNYWKSHNFTELGDGALDSMIEFAGKLPTPQCEVFVGHIAGAPNRVSPDAMAYGHRDAKFVMNVHGRWDQPSQDQKVIEWARGVFNATAPFASSGAYVNFMTEEEGDRVAAAYGANYERLVQIKRQYDPENIFHLNQNIKP
jgi:FAD/FMN-containing dehydrogenase